MDEYVSKRRVQTGLKEILTKDEKKETIVIIKRGLIILVTLRQRKGINGDDDKRKSCINKFCIINKTNEFFGFCCCYFKL